MKERLLTLRGIPFYLKGEKVARQQLGEYVTDPAYALDYYGDINGKIKAVVIRSSDAAEEKAKKELIAAPRNPIDWRGREAPVFERTDLAGNLINLAELKGKVVVLSFWFVDCRSCKNEIPELNRLKQGYKSEEVVFLAPSRNISQDMTEFLKKQPFHFNILPDSRSLSRRYGVMVYPMYFVIDQNGVVQFCQYEAHKNTRGILKEQIDLLLDK
ncbi:MAG: TlpA family protein disulfide reductase [Roseivirga sp.]|nr:TlpA family protein disulfide reductase [Roseivirga sp.]